MLFTADDTSSHVLPVMLGHRQIVNFAMAIGTFGQVYLKSSQARAAPYRDGRFELDLATEP